MKKLKSKGCLDTAVCLPMLGGVLLLCAILSLLFGATSLSAAEVLRGLFGRAEGSVNLIVQSIRLPRVLAGILAGAGLAVSGVLLQSVTDNALAGPNVIGVNAGAGLCVILLLAFFPAAAPFLPLAAFLGAFCATLLIVLFAGSVGTSHATVILTGVALSALLNAAISFISLLDTDVVASYNYFSVGGLAGVYADELLLPAILIAVSLAVSILLAPSMEALRLGDSTANALGVRVHRVRIAALICASASAAAAVSFAGLLGFVGLIVPHIARRLIGERIRPLLPASALLGGILVLLADLLGRTLFAPTEIPVGILMALIGAPFFLFLLFGRNRHA